MRHGQARHDSRGLYGPDAPLSELGHRQAASLADSLGSGPAFDAVYSSNLPRAVETAKAVAVRLGLEISVDERLAEFNVDTGLAKTFDDRPDLLVWHPDHTSVDGETLAQFACASGGVSRRGCNQTLRTSGPRRLSRRHDRRGDPMVARASIHAVPVAARVRRQERLDNRDRILAQGSHQGWSASLLRSEEDRRRRTSRRAGHRVLEEYLLFGSPTISIGLTSKLVGCNSYAGISRAPSL